MSASTVRDAMTVSPTTIEAHENAVDAARLMAAQDVGSLPVLEGEELVGIVTDRDLVLHVLAKDVDPHKVVVVEHLLRESRRRRARGLARRRAPAHGPRADSPPSRGRGSSAGGDPGAGGRLAHRRAGCDRPYGRGDLGALSSGGGRCRGSVGSRDEDRQPRVVVARRRLDAVGQTREDERETRVVLGTVAERADRHGDPPVLRVYLDRGFVAMRGIEHAQDGQLEIVHPLVREVEARANSAEHEARDTAEGAGSSGW